MHKTSSSTVFQASTARADTLVLLSKIFTIALVAIILAMLALGGPAAGILMLSIVFLFLLSMIFAMRKYRASIIHPLTLSEDGIEYEPFVKWIGCSFIPWSEVTKFKRKQLDRRWFIRLYFQKAAFQNHTHNLRLRKIVSGDSVLIPVDNLECNLKELYDSMDKYMHNKSSNTDGVNAAGS